MLSELHISNLGIIESVTVQFGQGFTAFTGETGAGKTMIIEAINMLVGGRSETGMVRHGASEARIEGRFVTGEDEVILCRVIPSEGRSRAYVNGTLATVAQLAELGAGLVDLHGQHAHQSLLHEKAQRGALDQFGKVNLAPLIAAKAKLSGIEKEIAGLGGDERARAREIDLLRFQVIEISEAKIISANEDDALRDEEEMLGNAVSHREALSRARGLLADDAAANDKVREAIHLLHARGVFAEVEARLIAVAAELDDVAGELRRLDENSEENPERLAEVSARRKVLGDLCKKYGPTVGDVIAYGDEVAQRLADLEGFDERALALEDGRLAAVAAVLREAKKVGAARTKAAAPLASAVEKRLRKLALPSAVVEVAVGVSPDDPAGDHVTFLISTNPGNPPAPLAKVASGGELARVMLALRLVLTQAPPSLVFDEVDAGIGGTAASAVGAALREVAGNHQVFVVTHLPQVAAQAENHIGIVKEVVKKATYARVAVLDGQDRVVEIARMLSGGDTSQAAIVHAKELLSR